MEKKTKIVLVVAIVLIVGLIGALLFVYIWASGSGPWPPECDTPSIFFKEENNTLIVMEISLPAYCDKELSDFDLIWENIKLWEKKEGNATLPNGSINVGDVITNCSGQVCLIWKPSGDVFWCSDFY